MTLVNEAGKELDWFIPKDDVTVLKEQCRNKKIEIETDFNHRIVCKDKDFEKIRTIYRGILFSQYLILKSRLKKHELERSKRSRK